MPREIQQAFEDRDQELLELMGVEKLPKTEIAPGVFVQATEEYMEGEKADELAAFHGKWLDKIVNLYDQYGLLDD